VEAYPVLVASDAVRALRAGASHCCWRKEEGLVACNGTLRATRPGMLSIAWFVHELPYVRPRSGGAIIRMADGKVGANVRPLFSCVSCGKAVAKLVLAGRRGRGETALKADPSPWKCQACHKLKYRSELSNVLQDNSKAEKLRELLRGGRPKGMWTSRHASLSGLVEEGRPQARWELRTRRMHNVGRATWSVSPVGEEVPREPDVVLVRDRFRYWEAYPRLEAAGARHAVKESTNLCLWAAEGRVIVGGAEVVRQADVLRVRYALQRTRRHLGAEGEVVFDILLEGSDDHNKRWLLGCPSCQRGRSSVGLVGSKWACRHCHGLDYRSALVGTAVRMAEKIARLRAELETLRSRGARRSMIKRQQALIEAEFSKTGDGPLPQANQDFCYMVRGYWCQGEFAEDGFYEALHAVGSDGENALALRPTSDQIWSVMFSSPSDHSPLQPAAPKLPDLIGERLFRDQPLESMLDSQFEDVASRFVREKDSGGLDVSHKVLAGMIVEEGVVEPLIVARKGGEPWVRKDDAPAGGGASAPEGETQVLATVCFRYSGDRDLWRAWPEGYGDFSLRGRTTWDEVELTARLPLGSEDQFESILREAGRVLHEIVEAQELAVRAFNLGLPKMAAAIVARARSEEKAMRRAEAGLRKLRF
jgi:hypothetical protein